MSTSGNTPLLSLIDVGLTYPLTRSLFRRESTRVLEGVSFELHAGQTLGIIGRNGSGKSSLLRLMAGVLQPDEGQVVRHRKDLRIALLTLQLGFQQQLSGRENALLGCLLTGLSRREALQLMPQIISFSGLTLHMDQPVSSYSSGMRARLGFSVAFLTRAEVMLIDEVMGVGDHEFKLKSRDALLEAILSDRTAVIVSHDEHFLAEMCDSLVWLERGRFVMHGRCDEVLSAYHDYDHIVLQLSAEMELEVEEVRAHPYSSEPLALIKRMRSALKGQREAALPVAASLPSHSAVAYCHPSRREILSTLCRQECGPTVWVENTAQIACGKDSEIRRLYLEYEDVLFAMAKASKVAPHSMRRAPIGRQLVQLMCELARHQETGR